MSLAKKLIKKEIERNERAIRSNEAAIKTHKKALKNPKTEEPSKTYLKEYIKVSENNIISQTRAINQLKKDLAKL